MLLLWQHVVRESRGHLLVGMGKVGLRCRGCWLRSCGWMCCLRWHLALRWSWHGAWHHLRVLLGYIALWSLVALGYLRPGLIAILLMWMQLTWEWLLVLGRNTRLRGHISMWVCLLWVERRVRARNSPRTSLVPLRQWLSNRLGVLLWLLLLLWLGCRTLGWALHGYPWLGNELGVGTHLWGYSIAS